MVLLRGPPLQLCTDRSRRRTLWTESYAVYYSNQAEPVPFDELPHASEDSTTNKHPAHDDDHQPMIVNNPDHLPPVNTETSQKILAATNKTPTNPTDQTTINPFKGTTLTISRLEPNLATTNNRSLNLVTTNSRRLNLVTTSQVTTNPVITRKPQNHITLLPSYILVIVIKPIVRVIRETVLRPTILEMSILNSTVMYGCKYLLLLYVFFNC